MKRTKHFPNETNFIFTIFDDTDVATFKYIKPIYDFLIEINIKTTKSVWPLTFNGECDDKGSHSLQDKDYADYIKYLDQQGFEIAYHGARSVSSKREEIEQSFNVFHELLGYYPRIYAAHSTNRDNLYWGRDRFSLFLFKQLYKQVISNKDPKYYGGHFENSPYYWGDICQNYIDYIRSFTYSEINLFNISNNIIYKNPKHPIIKSWFISSDADNVEEFNELICEKNQEKLEHERGICILSTHLGKGFIQNGNLHPETKRLLKILRDKNGWFVPVCNVLDFLVSRNENTDIGKLDLFLLELKWYYHLLIRHGRKRSYQKTEIEYLNKSKYR